MDYQNSRIAELYDLFNPLGPDTDFYLSLAGPRPCSVLDLGCGTGTLCCALAARGHRVTGVDPSAAMLAVAKRKPYGEEVEWVESSAQSYRSDRRFDLIVMTGHAFQVLLTNDDMLGALQTMRRHFKEHATAAFETRNPHIDWAGEWAARQRLAPALPGEQILETLEITANDGEFISFRTSYHLPGEALSTSSTLRFPSQAFIENMITRSELVVRNVFGNWERAPFEPARSRELIFLIAKAAP